MGFASSSADEALNAAPDLYNSPGMAVDAASSDDPAGTATILTQAQRAQAWQDTYNNIAGSEGSPDDGSGGILDHLLTNVEHWAGNVAHVPVLGTVLEYASKGLHEVQRDYRILHIAWTKDPGTALLATAAVVGGGALGSLIAPGIGTRFGATLGAELVGRGLTQISSQLQQDAELADDPNTKISLGRDISNAFGQVPGLGTLKDTDSGVGRIISGVTDAAADFGLDPIVTGFKLKTGIRAGDLGTLANTVKFGDEGEKLAAKMGNDPTAVKYLRHFLNGDVIKMAQWKKAGDWFDVHAPGTQIRNADQVQALWDSPLMGKSYRDAVKNIAAIGAKSAERAKPIAEGGEGGVSTAAGEIIQHYPQLQSATVPIYAADGTLITKGLGGLTTKEEVHNWFVNAAKDSEFADRLTHSRILPTRTLTRALGSRVSEGILQVGGGDAAVEGATAASGARATEGTIRGAVSTTIKSPFSVAREAMRKSDPVTQSGRDWTGVEFDATPGAKYQAMNRVATALRASGDDVRYAWTGAIARKVRSFSGYMPFAADAKTLGMSTKTFKWEQGKLDPLAAQGVLRSMRFGMGVNRSRYHLDRFVNATSSAEAERIFAEANVENMIAFGFPDHAQALRVAKDKLAEITGGPVSSPKNQYAVGARKGRDVDNFDGDKDALWSHQATTEFAFPNYNLMKYEMGKLGGAFKASYTGFDDMVLSRVVQNVFKPLALLNAGFGLRIAMSEMIPQAMRTGILQTVKDYTAATASRKNYALVGGEDYHIAAAAMHLLRDSGDEFLQGIKGTQLKDIQETNPGRYQQFKDKGARDEDYIVRPKGSKATKALVKAGVMPVRTLSGTFWHGMNVFLNDPAARDFALPMTMAGEGHIAQGLAATGESGMGYHMDEPASYRQELMNYETGQRYRGDSRLKDAATDEYTAWGRDYNRYHELFHGNLAKVGREESAQLIAKDLLSGNEQLAVAAETRRVTEAIAGRGSAAYLNDAKSLRAIDKIRAGRITAEDFAASRVDAIRGMTEGADGTIHTDWLNSMARGEKISVEAVNKVAYDSLPGQVYGPIHNTLLGDNLLQRVVNKGFSKAIDPIINHLSRDPMYFNNVYAEYKNLLPQVKAGRMTEDDIMQIARTRGAVGMLPKIHNTALRSQFSQLVKNFLPFYFAQEQALKRAGGLMAEHPGAFRQYQLVEHGVSDPGFVQTDANGNKYFLFPTGGALGDAMMHLQGWFGEEMQFGLPISIKGNMTSLKTLFPEVQMPGVSPIVSIPLNKIAGMFPELAPTIKNVIGGAAYQGAVIDALLPHPLIKNVYRAIDADTRDRQFNNAFVTALATAVGRGEAPGPDATAGEKDAFIDRIKNNTRSLFMTKALLGLVSPLAPQVNIDDGLRDEFQALVKQKQDAEGNSQGYKDAIAEFIQNHGSKAVAYTIGKTVAAVDGASLPYTQEAFQWLESPDVVAGMKSPFQTGLAFLTPQEGTPGDKTIIGSELIRMKLRSTQTPDGFLDKVNIAQGYADISEAQKVHKANLAKYNGDSKMTSAENAAWSKYIRDYGVTNNSWYEDYQSPKRTQTALTGYQDLVDIMSGGARKVDGKVVAAPVILARTPMYDKVGVLVQSQQRHLQLLAMYKGTHQATLEREEWQKWLDKQANDDPSLTPVINGIFKRLDSSGLTVNG